uniref:Myb-like domain-containing protein n=1 Tax=Ditylenchus dipsaci TaxID=166011 RepID=A0A915EMT7_9BILA
MENQDNIDECSPIALRYRAVHRRVIESPAVESKPVSKVRAAKERNRKKYKLVQTAEETFSKPTPPKKKRWSALETQRLKNVLKVAINPQTDDDWTKIARTTGERTGAECQEHAKKIQWVPPIHPRISQLATSYATDHSEDDVEGPNGYSTSTPKSICKKYSDSKKNRFEADFFGAYNRQQDISILELDPDDSLLQALGTPQAEPRPKKIRRPFMMKVITESPIKNHSSDEEN